MLAERVVGKGKGFFQYQIEINHSFLYYFAEPDPPECANLDFRQNNSLESAEERVFNWKKEVNINTPDLYKFEAKPGLKVDLKDESELRIYKLFASKEMFTKISEETNRYAEDYIAKTDLPKNSSAQKWIKTNCGEIMIFWDLCMLMRLLGKPVLALYWSTREIISTPFLPKIVTRDRFQMILRFLHFNNNNNVTNKDDKLFKVRPVYYLIINSFSKVNTPLVN